MSEHKIVIFNSTAIQHLISVSDLESREDAKAFVYDGTWAIVSTGALEAALDAGAECFFLSTRDFLGVLDAWWIELIGPLRIFLPPTRSKFLKSDADFDERLMMPWRQLFDELWIDFDFDRIDHWSQVQDHLAELGLQFGWDCMSA